MASIKILNGGLLTTVQDLGRYGYQRYGVSPSGVMDEFSAKVANKLVGNKIDDAVLETTLKGIDFEVLEEVTIAITGGDCDIKLNDEKIEAWKSHTLKPKDVVKMGMCKKGLRSYIAFSGGVDVPVVMNSRSTNLKAKIGGYKGRKLQTGDVIKTLGSITEAITSFKPEFRPEISKEIEVRVILGQQDDYITEEGITTFFSETYKIAQESDRMGMRLGSLSEKAITHKNGADIVSDGITFGAIQIPGNGQPIIMMADRQTTGGYTKIGNVISTDLSKLAQAVPGTKVKFINCSSEDAVEKIKVIENTISSLNSYVVEAKKEINIYKISMFDKSYEVSVERIG